MEELQKERKTPPWGYRGSNDPAMAAPSIFSKFLHRADHTRPQGIQMNVPDEFQEIRLRLDWDRPEPVLEQMPHPVMPPVEIQGVSRHQAMHESGEDTVFALRSEEHTSELQSR